MRKTCDPSIVGTRELTQSFSQCIAINDATSLVFENNKCNGGHGISIGSIKTRGGGAREAILSTLTLFLPAERLSMESQSGENHYIYLSDPSAYVDLSFSCNTVTASQNGLRIKTYVGATDASVSDVVYSGNSVRTKNP